MLRAANEPDFRGGEIDHEILGVISDDIANLHALRAEAAGERESSSLMRLD
jgi:hypothetical protein